VSADTVRISIFDDNNVVTYRDAACYFRCPPLCVSEVKKLEGVQRMYAITHIESGRRLGPIFCDGQLARECCEHLVAVLGADFFDVKSCDMDEKKKRGGLVRLECAPFLDKEADFGYSGDCC
jgi:hypothetical protein